MTYPQTTFIHTTFFPTNFLSKKRNIVQENTLLYQLNVLKKTGRYDAFKLEKHHDKPSNWPPPHHLFWDSDVAKWVEGACYFLLTSPSPTPEISAAVTELADMIAHAQQPDGYINIHYTIIEPGKRFTNLRDMHELYNCGHLIEAALAHSKLNPNSVLLNALVKYVNLLCRVFGPGKDQIHGYPGHSEIELALLRLYAVTHDSNHLKLAEYFISERGNPRGSSSSSSRSNSNSNSTALKGEKEEEEEEEEETPLHHFYDAEAENRNEPPLLRPNSFPMEKSYWYMQAHKPILDQDTIQGHSVRAMYLLTAVADLERHYHHHHSEEENNVDDDNSSNNNNKKKSYKKVLNKLWQNMVEKKMYLTGGIGAIDQWEGFGIDYFLPQSTDEGGSYAETCASVGVMMLAERLLQIDLNGKYTDIMELAFLNTVLGGMSHDGRKFTYTNQLGSSDTNPSKREEWFTCACCPPNVTRTLGYLGGYLWSFRDKSNGEMSSLLSAGINVHMFGAAELTFEVGGHTVVLRQDSDWPWDGKIKFQLRCAEAVQTIINVRIPGWAASDWTLSPELPNANVQKGYLRLPAEWLRKHPNFELNIPLVPRLLSPHPLTNQDVVAVARGPLIYCVEDVDNSWVNDHFKSLLFDTSATIEETKKTDSATNEAYIMLTASGPFSFLDLEDGLKASPGLSPDDADSQTGQTIDQLHFVPYYYRANRGGKGHMRVGLRRARSWMQIAAN